MAWSYSEHLQYIQETYQEFKEENMSNKEALARTFSEYETAMNVSETKKAIICTVCLEIAITHSKILNTFKNYLIDKIKVLNIDSIKQDLTQVEFEDLMYRRNFVLQEIEKIPLDYYPRVCWHYEELTIEVQKFSNEMIKVSNGTKEIIASVYERFDRACKNTTGEKSIVLTTLAESLMNNESPECEEFNNIKQYLKLLNLDDISHEQLSENEKKQLSDRIKDVLIR